LTASKPITTAATTIGVSAIESGMPSAAAATTASARSHTLWRR
jgi:hypothetical protein